MCRTPADRLWRRRSRSAMRQEVWASDLVVAVCGPALLLAVSDDCYMHSGADNAANVYWCQSTLQLDTLHNT